LLEESKEGTYFTKSDFNEEIKFKFGKYKTEYDINLLNVEQIKSQLKNLIPKLIIRIGVKNLFRAYSEPNSNIMVINEEEILQQNMQILYIYFKIEENSKTYIIPITMEILYKMVNKDEKSPKYYRDSRNNFELKETFKFCKTYDKKDFVPISEPDSGRVLEKYISENERIISDLKIPKKENVIFIYFKYWIGPNFNELENYILNNIKDDENNSMNDDKYIYYYNRDLNGCYIDRSYMMIK